MAKSVRQTRGVLSADINFASGMLLLEYESDDDPRRRVAGVLAGAGLSVEPLDRDGMAAPAGSWWMSNRGEVMVGASGVLLVVGMVLGMWAEVPANIAYACAIIVGGGIVWRRAVASLMARTLDMNVLMTLAVCGAAALGEWGEGATVIVLFALGGLLEARSVARTRSSIRDLMALAPVRARVRREGREFEVTPTDVKIGETILVRPGERVPLDGIVSTGVSALDESPITGESVPVDRGPGGTVFAGSLNTSGALEITTTSAAEDTTLARIVHLVEVAQASRAPVQRFVDRFSRIYTPVVLALAIALAVGAPLLGEAGAGWPGLDGWGVWVYRALVLLVISCPCALVVSTPVAIVSGITRATRDGVLVKGGAFLERAAKVRAIAFDKTGTLTEGRPVVTEVRVFGEKTPARVLAVAAAVEAHSTHPLATAVVAAAAGETIAAATGVREEGGRGVSGTVEGAEVVVGSVRHLASRGIPTDPLTEPSADLEERGSSVLAVAVDGRVIGLIGVADAVRSGARQAVASLLGGGIDHVAMLTGDNPAAAGRVASEIGITEYEARLLPGDKTEAVGRLKARYGVVAVVGDGVNDAPALAAADIGIAMGAAGSHTAIETADVALMRDDLAALPDFFALGRRTMSIVRQNVVLSLGVKAVFIALAVTGHATLWMAVFADTGIALVVIANSLRLLRRR